MTDCLRTLHAVMRDPDELAAARRLRCPRAQKIVDQTEKDWSEKC